jgi:hypothetical protein
VSRRLFLGTLAALSATALLPRRVDADDYALPVEVFDAIDRLEAGVDARLRSIAAALPSAETFAAAVFADHERFRRVRAGLRRRLRVPAGAVPAPPAEPDRSLEALRTAQEALVHAHAEGLPALGDSHAVDVLAHHMVEGSRHLTVIDLWIEMEAARA